jgi:hypothetical protein
MGPAVLFLLNSAVLFSQAFILETETTGEVYSMPTELIAN